MEATLAKMTSKEGTSSPDESGAGRTTLLAFLSELVRGGYRSPASAEFDAMDRATLSGRRDADHEEMASKGLISVALENVALNRYSNILPYNRCLVQLQRPVHGSTFINASHVSLPDSGMSIIIAQGPMHPDYHGPDTTCAFWQMVHEQRPKAIACLAEVAPGYGGLACYWPQEVGAWKQYGNVDVRLDREAEAIGPVIMRRSLSVRRSAAEEGEAAETLPGRGQPDDGGETYRVTQLHFTAWPNYGVAEDLSDLLRFAHLLDDAARAGDAAGGVAGGGPEMVIHCSGGVGRSGTLAVAMDGLRRLPTATPVGKLSLAGAVAAMREMRHPWMVEGPLQYLLAYRLLVAELLVAEQQPPDTKG